MLYYFPTIDYETYFDAHSVHLLAGSLATSAKSEKKFPEGG